MLNISLDTKLSTFEKISSPKIDPSKQQQKDVLTSNKAIQSSQDDKLNIFSHSQSKERRNQNFSEKRLLLLNSASRNEDRRRSNSSNSSNSNSSNSSSSKNIIISNDSMNYNNYNDFTNNNTNAKYNDSSIFRQETNNINMNIINNNLLKIKTLEKDKEINSVHSFPSNKSNTKSYIGFRDIKQEQDKEKIIQVNESNLTVNKKTNFLVDKFNEYKANVINRLKLLILEDYSKTPHYIIFNSIIFLVNLLNFMFLLLISHPLQQSLMDKIYFINIICSGIFLIEIIFKIIVLGKSYFKDFMNMLDLIVILAGILEIIITNSNMDPTGTIYVCSECFYFNALPFKIQFLFK